MLVASLERRLEQIPVKSCVGSLAGEETGTDSRQELCWQPRWGGDWNRFPSRAVLAASLGRILDQIPVKSCVGSLAGEDTRSDSHQELCWQPRWRNSCPSPRPQISTHYNRDNSVNSFSRFESRLWGMLRAITIPRPVELLAIFEDPSRYILKEEEQDEEYGQ